MAHFQSISSEQWVSCKRSCCVRWLCFENFVAVHNFFKYTNSVKSNDDQGIWVCKETELTVLKLPVFKGLWSPPSMFYNWQFSKDYDPHQCSTTTSFQRIMIPPSMFYNWQFVKDYDPPINVLQLPVFKGLWSPSMFYNCQFSKDYAPPPPLNVLQLPVFKGLWSPPLHVLQLPVFKRLWSPPPPPPPIKCSTTASFQRIMIPPINVLQPPVFKRLWSPPPPPPPPYQCSTTASFQKIMIPPPPPPSMFYNCQFLKGLWSPPINVLQLPVLKRWWPPPPPTVLQLASIQRIVTPRPTHHCFTIGQFLKDYDMHPPPPAPPYSIHCSTADIFWRITPHPPPDYSSHCSTTASFQRIIVHTPCTLLMSLWNSCQFSKNDPPQFHWSITASFKRITLPPPKLYFNVLQLPVLKWIPPPPPPPPITHLTVLQLAVFKGASRTHTHTLSTSLTRLTPVPPRRHWANSSGRRRSSSRTMLSSRRCSRLLVALGNCTLAAHQLQLVCGGAGGSCGALEPNQGLVVVDGWLLHWGAQIIWALPFIGDGTCGVCHVCNGEDNVHRDCS